MFYPYEGYRSVTPLDADKILDFLQFFKKSFYKKLKNVSCVQFGNITKRDIKCDISANFVRNGMS